MKIKNTKSITDAEYGLEDTTVAVVLRYDDACENGHNSFSIIVESRDFGGCCHDLVERHWPEYADLIKWHLCSDDGPLHYVENTVWHVADHYMVGIIPKDKQQDLDAARRAAIWPEATDAELTSEDLTLLLALRLPELLKKFHEAIRNTFPQFRSLTEGGADNE